MTSLGSVFYNLAASYLKEIFTVLCCSLWEYQLYLYLKLYILFLMVARSCKNNGLFLCIILKVSKAIVLILRVLSEGNLEFWSSVSYELSESLQINRNMYMCTKCNNIITGDENRYIYILNTKYNYSVACEIWVLK